MMRYEWATHKVAYLLAADRVYHHALSPVREAVLRLRFSLSVASAEGGEALLSSFCGTFPRITPGCR